MICVSILTKPLPSGYAVVHCAHSPNAMAAVRSGQGCLTLCGDKRDLWLPKFLTRSDDDTANNCTNVFSEQMTGKVLISDFQITQELRPVDAECALRKKREARKKKIRQSAKRPKLYHES
jgi:hypothetical protein